MDRIDRFDLVRELGRGAMGVVYEVQDRSRGQRYALKLMLEARPDLEARFSREARVLQILGVHPHIVGSVEVGSHQGRLYIVMDLVADAITMDSALRTARLDPRAAAAHLVTIGRALHFAHEAGIIHRDVKLANILLDGAGTPFLTDFGVARNLQASSLTQTGQLVGTPTNMAPEQLDGKESTVDRRTDVYGLGVVLYEVLAGRPPFLGDATTLLRSIALDRPAPPSAHGPNISPALDALCLAALEKDRDARPASAEVFARELEDALSGAAPRASPPGWSWAPLALVWLLSCTAAALLPLFLGQRERARLNEVRVIEQLRRGAVLSSELAATLTGADFTEAALSRFARHAQALQAIRAGAPDGLARAEALPAGAEGAAVRLEALLTLGRDSEAWPLLPQIAALGPPWFESASATCARLGRQVELAERRGTAARLYVQAALKGKSRDSPGAAALLERAITIDLGAAFEEGGSAAASLLARAAAEDLKTPSVASITRAATRLSSARLCDRRLDLSQEKVRLLASADGPDPRRAEAARPWLNLWRTRVPIQLSVLAAALAKPCTPADLRRVDSHDFRTLPEPWAELLDGAKQGLEGEDLRACLLDWLVSRPELSALWYRAGRASWAAGHLGEGVWLCGIAAELEQSTETLKWLGEFLIEIGRREEGLTTLKRADAKNRAGPLPFNSWVTFELAFRLLDRARPEDPAEALRLLDEERVRGEMGRYVRYHLTRAELLERLGRTPDAEAARLQATRLKSR